MGERVRRKRVHRYTTNTRRVRKNAPKPNYGMLVCVFLVAVVVSGAAAFALQTPTLLVKEVKITGVALSNSAEVSAAAKPALGKNILLLAKSPIVRNIRAIPEIAEVKVGRSFPDGVWVRVRERKADAVLASSQGFCMLQADGLAFHSAKGPVRGIPTLEVAKCESMKEGLKCRSTGVECGLEVVKLAREERLPVVKISVDPLGDICLNMKSGFFVKLGQPDDIARKMSLLRSALVCKPSIVKEAAYIDLSCPDAPVWKPRIVAGTAS